MKIQNRIRNLIIVFLQARQGFVWEPSLARYRSKATGRLVAERTIISKIDRYDDAIASNARTISQRLVDGKITSTEWRELMAREVKDAYIIQIQAGAGGKVATTQADYGRVGGRLKFEYRRLDQFQKEWDAGTVSDAQILARSELYARGSRTAFFDGQTAAKERSGFTEERRRLGIADHCPVCLGFVAQGWREIGFFPEPGTECDGLHNCKCFKEFR